MTNLQGDIRSPGVKAKWMLPELYSLGGGTITLRASLGRGCFSHLSALSWFPCPKEKASIASCFHAKKLPPSLLSTFILGKKGGRAARAEALFSTPPTWLTTARHPRLHAVLWPTFCSEQRSRRRLLTLASRHSCQVCRHSPSLHLLRCTLIASLNGHRDKLDPYKGIIQGRNNLNIYFSSCLLLSPLSSHENKPIYNFTHTNTLDTHGKHLLVSLGEIPAWLLLCTGKTSSTQIHCKP